MISFFTKVIMFPFSVVYGLFIILRNFLFDIKYYKPIKFNKKVIAVGNLIMGGSGKTPHVEYLINILLKKKKNISVISRGYNRETSGMITLSEKDDFRTVGDEPIQYFKKFNNEVKVMVSENRVKALNVNETDKIDVNILDDAYQQRLVKPDMNILLSSIKRPFYKDFIFPVGMLREYRKNANRADFLIFSGCDKEMKETERDEVILKAKQYLNINTPILFSHVRYDEPKKVFGNKFHNDVIAVSSIAYPDSFFSFLQSKYKLIKTFKFKDHHTYKDKDLLKVIKECDGDISILTTEKDAVKLCEYKHLLGSYSVYYVPIKVSFLFNNSISNYLGE
ncbi:MAG: tetraacyldisaccharide 4'-kinase [Flammeovirgaceae bacterium]|nr:tetraacyldisaccharide 4'-kinase [Flammeovirgaceae bacterium]